MADGGFRRMQIVEESDSDSDAGAAGQPESGWRKMDIVEASDSSDGETPAVSSKAQPQHKKEADPFPDLCVECSRQGIERAKSEGNSLFSKGSVPEAVRWLSKALWLVETRQVADAPSDLHSILLSNRANAYLKLQKWADADQDCTAALAKNAQNLKATFRRAIARYELGKSQDALQDVEEVIRAKPDPLSSKEAEELREKIKAKLGSAKPSSPADKGGVGAGFRRMQIVEVDEESDDDAEAGKAAATPSTPSSGGEAFPDLKVDFTLAGVEKAKSEGSSCFVKGALEESVRWFSKGLWLVESKRVKNVPKDLHSFLHSNRAFAYIKLKKWVEAEKDSNMALDLSASNTKAKYRRGLARFELGRTAEALVDVEAVLKELPAAQAGEAVELKKRIDEQLKTKPAKPPSPKAAEPPKEASDPDADELFPDIKVEHNRQGVETAKNAGNTLFAKGSLEESVRWFSKGIWLVESKKASDVPAELQSILHANRAFACVKLQRWAEAEKDCDAALALNAKNTKAEYRRAVARFELGKLDLALADVEKVLRALPDPSANKEAVELKAKIQAKLKAPQQTSPKEASKPAGFKRMEIVEASDSEEEAPAPAAKTPSPKASPKEASKPAAGFKRMEIVEASDSEEDEAPAPAKAKSPQAAAAEMFPDLKVEQSKAGVEKAKNEGNSAFSKGSVEEAVRWFSKGLWLIDSKKVTDAPSDLHSILHSNRAFAYVKLQKWAEAEADCSAALGLNPKNTKAKFRRALSRFELGKAATALEDVEQVLKEIPDAPANREAVELKAKIDEQLKKQKQTSPKEASKPAAGFKRMEIVEASDSEEEAPAPAKAKSPQAAAAEMFPDLKVEQSKAGVEKAKNEGNSAFSKGSVEEAVRWFSKGLWLVEVKKVTDVTSDLHSILYSNRAFARVKLQQWAEAEQDCSKALELNSQNTKARYRRALSRFELGKAAAALEDVEQALKELPSEHASYKEAAEFKEKILKSLGKVAAKAEPATSADPFPDIAVTATRQGIEAAKTQANGLFAKGKVEESAKIFSKALWLVESKQVADVPQDLHAILYSNRAFAYVTLKKWAEAESDASAALQLNPENVKARYRRALARSELGNAAGALEDVEQVLKEVPDSQGSREAVDLKQKVERQLGKPRTASKDKWTKVSVVACDEDESEEEAADEPRAAGSPKGSPKAAAAKPASPQAKPATPPAAPKQAAPEPHPYIVVEHSVDGIEKAKTQGNTLFSKGQVKEATLWFSKAIWLIKNKKVTGVSNELTSVLHSNRAFANIKLSQWAEAESDCTAALIANAGNTKALYRRAWARFEMGDAAAALKDVDDVLQELKAPQSNREAVELRERILKKLGKSTEAAKRPSLADELPHSEEGLHMALHEGNELFQQGKTHESVKWFSKGIALADEGKVKDVADSDELLSVLHANRAKACVVLEQWEEAEEDWSLSLALRPQNFMALYHRALARSKLGKRIHAFEDADMAARLQPDNAEVAELRRRLSQEVGSLDDVPSEAPKPAAKPAPEPAAKPTPKPAPKPAAAAANVEEEAPRRQVRPGRAANVSLAAPTVPSQSPKNAFELLRNFNSMKKHPEVLAKYICERVPPQHLEGLFTRAPIEADDLSTVLFALRDSFGSGVTAENLADYLRHLLRTRQAETQFKMLSNSEKEVLRSLSSALPPGNEALQRNLKAFFS